MLQVFNNITLWDIITVLLGALQVSVYNLVLVEVVHASGDLLGPLHQLLGVNFLPVSQEVEEGPEGAVLHDNTEHRGLDTDSPGDDNCQTTGSDCYNKLT